MKICDIVQFHSPLSGGIKRYVSDKIRFVATREDMEHVVIIPGARNRVSVEGRSRIHEIRSLPMIGSTSYRMLLSRKQILRILDEEAPDLIEVGDPYRSAWVGVEYARKRGCPVIAYYHSEYPRAFGRTAEKFLGPIGRDATSWFIDGYLARLHNLMDVTVVATERVKETLKAIGIQRIVRIPLGTDTEVFRPCATREEILEELDLTRSRRLIVYAGRIAREKHVLELFPMMDRLRRRIPGCHLLIVGDGEERRKVERLAAGRNDVTWLPYRESPRDLARFYSAADLCVYPGDSETFGLVSIEAQSCGARTLVIRGGGADDTVEGETPAVLADAPTGEALAEAAARLLSIPETPEDRLRRRARIVAHFSWRKTYTDLTELYRRLCRSTKRLAA